MIENPQVYTICCLLLATMLVGCSIQQRVRTPAPLREISGGAVFQDKIFVLNDGGNPASLYEVNEQGRIVVVTPLPIKNIDFEAMAVSDSGLWIGDIGNNLNRRRDLTIHHWNPYSQAVVSFPIAFSDQTAFPPPAGHWEWDAEAMIWTDSFMHIYTKDRFEDKRQWLKHYTWSPKDSTAQLIDKLALHRAVATDAAYNPSTGGVDILTYHYRRFLGFIPLSSTRIYQFDDVNIASAKCRCQKIPFFPIAPQYETLIYKDPNHWWLASEQLFFMKGKWMVLKRRKGRGCFITPF